MEHTLWLLCHQSRPFFIIFFFLCSLTNLIRSFSILITINCYYWNRTLSNFHLSHIHKLISWSIFFSFFFSCHLKVNAKCDCTLVNKTLNHQFLLASGLSYYFYCVYMSLCFFSSLLLFLLFSLVFAAVGVHSYL